MTSCCLTLTTATSTPTGRPRGSCGWVCPGEAWRSGCSVAVQFNMFIFVLTNITLTIVPISAPTRGVGGWGQSIVPGSSGPDWLDGTNPPGERRS